jgi:hypothetical protein
MTTEATTAEAAGQLPGSAVDVDDECDAREADYLPVLAARSDPNAFIEYVLRDEETRAHVDQAAVHEEWHRLIDAHDRLVLLASVESGKSFQLSVGRVLYEVGRDPSLRCAIVSNTHAQAAKIMRAHRSYVERSPELRAVFPALQPGDPWTDSALTVRRQNIARDPTIQAFGIHGAVLGSRIDLLVLDDILDYENTRTDAQREKLWQWIKSTLLGRLTARSRVVAVGTAWHPEDALHRFATMPGFEARRYPLVSDTGESRWPARWTVERIARKREELGPLEFARQVLCLARDETSARFKREWIDVALKRGDGNDLRYALNTLPQGVRTYTGVDLAVQQHAGADWTVLATIAVWPDGTRELIGLERGRWSGPEIVDHIVDAHRRYMSVCVVENNASQEFILQFARAKSAVPIVPFTTGRNKAHPEFGVESLAAEMASGKWSIPNHSGRLDATVGVLVREMLYYDPNAHTGDALMALWFAREGVRLGAPKKRAAIGSTNLMAR